MKEEDVEVDISANDEVVNEKEMELRSEVKDEDALWAEEDPDEDSGDWKMKVLMSDDADM